MSDQQKNDSVLMGFADEPKFYEGQLSSWRVKLRDFELKEILDRYLMAGKDGAGSVSITLFMSKSGKPFARVYNPNSESAREYKAKREQEQKASEKQAAPAKAKAVESAPADDDLPF